LREHLVREIRTFKPDAVLCTDPEAVFHRGGGVNHTDHRAAGMAAVDAVYPAARNPMAFPALARAGLDKHVVRRLYLFWSERPDVWVDITDTVERKLAALAAHASQIREPAKLEQRIREWAAEEGQPVGVGGRGGARLIVIEEDEVDELVEGGCGRGYRRGARVRRLGASHGSLGRAVEGQDSSRRTGRTRPQAFQISVRPSARRPSIATKRSQRHVAGRGRPGARRPRPARR
jgi:hypothetical protein